MPPPHVHNFPETPGFRLPSSKQESLELSYEGIILNPWAPRETPEWSSSRVHELHLRRTRSHLPQARLLSSL